MEAPVFADKSKPPSDADLATALGRAKAHWDRLLADADKLSAGAPAEWKYYSGKAGWTLVLRGRSRNLLYLRPLDKRIAVSLAFSDEALAAAEQADLPEPLVQSIRESPKYPEGRAVRLEVAAARDVKTVGKLLQIKLAN